MNTEEPVKQRTPIDEAALTRMLRVSGAVLLVASASTFMLQHWGEGNDLGRYALLVGHSVLLALAAYFCGLRVNESRGARTFLALILAIVPTTFAVLGGLVYSRFHWEPIAALPNYARWVAPTDAAALLAVLGTLVVLVPLGAIAFATLARKETTALTLAFFAQNLALLVPLRKPDTMVVVFGISMAVLTELELRRFRRIAELSTLEGRLSRASLFIAPLLLAGRAIHLYDPSRLFVGGVFLTAAYVAYAHAARLTCSATRDAAALGSAALGVTGWLFCYSEIVAHLSSNAASVVLLGLPIAGVVMLASRRATLLQSPLMAVGGTIALLTAVVAPLVELSTSAALGCIVTGVAVLAWGAARRSLVYTLAGAAVGIVGVGLQVSLAVQADDFVRWGSLMLGGVLLIVGASLADRYKGRLSTWFRPSADRE